MREREFSGTRENRRGQVLGAVRAKKIRLQVSKNRLELSLGRINLARA